MEKLLLLLIIVVCEGKSLPFLFYFLRDYVTKCMCKQMKTKQAPLEEIWPLKHNYGNLITAQIETSLMKWLAVIRNVRNA